MPARKFRHSKKRLRVLESAPAIHQHEQREGSVPDRTRVEREANKSNHSDKTEDGGYLKTAGSPDKKPK